MGLLPELTGRKLAAQDDACAREEPLPDTANAASAMVERQGEIDPVPGSDLARPDKGPHHAAGPGIGELGRLRQAGRAGGIDVKSQIGSEERRPVLARRSLFGSGLEGRMEVFPPLNGAIKGPDFQIALQLAIGGFHLIGLLTTGDQAFGVCDVDAMGEAAAFQIVIDQSRHDANLRQAKPAGHILRTVVEEKRHTVARLEALIQRPIGELIGPRLKLAIAGEITLETEGDVVGIFVHDLFKVIGQKDLAFRINGAGPFQRATHTGHKGQFSLQPIQHTHLSAPYIVSSMHRAAYGSVNKNRTPAIKPSPAVKHCNSPIIRANTSSMSVSGHPLP